MQENNKNIPIDVMMALKILGIYNALYKELKVGLSAEDREKMANKIKDMVLLLLNYGHPISVPNKGSLPAEGGNGIYVTDDTGHWWTWDGAKWVDRGEFISTKALDDLEKNKRNNLTIYANNTPEFATAMTAVTDVKSFYTYFYNERKATFSTWQLELSSYQNIIEALSIPSISGKSALVIERINTEAGGYFLRLYITNDSHSTLYTNIIGGWLTGCVMGAWQDLKNATSELLKGIYKVLATDGQGDQIGLDYSVLAQPNTFALRQADGTIAVGTPKEDNDAVNLAYLRSIGVGMDAADLLAMFDNAGDGLIIDLSEDGQHLHVHLDGVDVEKELLVKIYGRNKQSVTLDGVEVNGNEQRDGLRGLRMWIKFPYNGNKLVMHQDIRFPSKQFRNGFQWYITNVIPNPSQFSDKIILQYDWDTNELKLKTTGGSISADIQLIDVKGIA